MELIRIRFGFDSDSIPAQSVFTLRRSERLGFALLIDGLDTEFVLATWSEASDFQIGFGSGCHSGRHPTSGGFIHLLHLVVIDRNAAIIRWRLPFQSASFSVDVLGFQRSTRRSWFIDDHHIHVGDIFAVDVLSRYCVHSGIGAGGQADVDFRIVFNGRDFHPVARFDLFVAKIPVGSKFVKTNSNKILII